MLSGLIIEPEFNKLFQVEREKNGFEARWCGNRVTQGGSRPHVIFARSEVTTYQDLRFQGPEEASNKWQAVDELSTDN